MFDMKSFRFRLCARFIRQNIIVDDGCLARSCCISREDEVCEHIEIESRTNRKAQNGDGVISKTTLCGPQLM